MSRLKVILQFYIVNRENHVRKIFRFIADFLIDQG